LIAAIAGCILLKPSPCDHENQVNAANDEEAERRTVNLG